MNSKAAPIKTKKPRPIATPARGTSSISPKATTTKAGKAVPKGAAATDRTILLFEDTDSIASALKGKIEAHLGRGFEVVVFPLDTKPQRDDGTYEDRLIQALNANQYKNLVLIVTDRDLSTKAENWGGLSEAAVSRAAQTLGYPVACYRKVAKVPEDAIRRIPGDGRIELPSNHDELAKRVAILAKGFITLEDTIQKRAAKTSKSNSTQDSFTPGDLLADALGHPEVASHLDTYACGAQNAIAEILNFDRQSGIGAKGKIQPKHQRQLIVALGVWLADLVMQYPGVLLNEKAAASYLDILPAHFKKSEVREVFKSAEYVNLPFSDPDFPLWWRHLLDSLVSEEDVSTGRDLCVQKGIKGLKFCPCSVDKTLHAGFYCMASEAPLSSENSSGRVSWFPPGADLARITASTHRKLGPWIGS